MNEYEALFYSDELTHHGVLNMHWGIRRYQNKDGSYKPGAEGRYAPKGTAKKEKTSKVEEPTETVKKEENTKTKESSSLIKKIFRKKDKEEVNPSEDYEKSRKKRQEMSNDELQEAINRLNKEQQYEQYIEKLDPKDKGVLKDKKSNAESIESKNAKKYDAKSMTNDELKEAIERLEKEKKLTDLQREMESPASRWLKDTTSNFLKDVGDTLVGEVKKGTKDYLTGEQSRKDAEAAYKSAKNKLNYATEMLKNEREKMKKKR